MKKKIIALILIIPLLFLITIFSVGKVAGIFTDIPASGIKITTQTENGILYLDMAKYEKDIYLEAEVQPQNAKNKDYKFEISKVDEETPLADIEIASDGLLIVRSEGKAKITAISADKGFTDSMILSVHSSKILSMVPILKTVFGESIALQKVGDSTYNTTITSGEYEFGSIINPVALSDSDVTWHSEDDSVIDIDEVTGRAKARLSGTSKVTLTSNNGINGVISATINVTVPYSGGASGMTIEGKIENSLVFSKGSNVVSFYIELEEANKELGNTQYLGFTGSGASLIINQNYAMLDTEGKKFKLTLTLVDEHPNNIELLVNVPGNSVKSGLELVFNDFKFDIFTKYHLTKEDTIYQKIENSVVYTAVGDPADKEITYAWESNGLNITTSKKGAIATIEASGTGIYTLTVSAYEKGNIIFTKNKTIGIVKGVQSIEFIDNAKTYGVENILTIGGTTDGSKTHRHELKMNVRYADGSVSEYTGEDITFSTSNSDVIGTFQTADEFRVVTNGNGIATIGAMWQYGEYFSQDIKTSIRLRGVKDGMMVDTYDKLKSASKQGIPIILTADVMLGQKNDGTYMNTDELKKELKKMPTDYDWTFYKNMDIVNGKDVTRPEVSYILEFTNDVYGNGYTINADKFTMARDSVGNPVIFKGPLNFVSAAGASVKAQDDIVFLVRNDNVTIDNVNLLGCSNESLIDEETGGIDLTRLNYAGTTLEISADNCNLVNSRVSNGRNVVRIYGGETTNGTPIVENFDDFDINEERIHVRIESSILTGAREFILKIGSNRAILPPKYPSMDEYQQRAFFDGNGKAYDAGNKNNHKNSEFYNNYVITDVTLKNSVLENSGLLSIGMETHFSGSMLDGYSLFATTWNRCSSTAFASVLRMEGEVKMYDWKKLDNVDSSTLIETEAGTKEFLTLRIADMLKKVAEVKPDCANIITDVNGQDYLHGGIAFYGGGYNYSCIDMDKFSGEPLSRYSINISVLAEGVTNMNDPLYSQGTYLPLAAGTEPFTFYMYNKDSTTNYDKQVADIKSGNAYKLPVAVIG